MGIYLNSGNDGYREILQSEYVDKTGLIALINNTLGTTEKLTCTSRPRRFGKSYAAKMLCAYYDCSCDSRNLFDDKEIARSQDYLTHLNQYQVISLDITGFISDATIRDIPLSNMPNMIADAVRRDLTKSYPEMEGKSLADAMIGCAEKSGKRFVLVIDEWDAVIREAKGDTMVQRKCGRGVSAEAQVHASGAGGGAEMEQAIRRSHPADKRAQLPCNIEGLWR